MSDEPSVSETLLAIVSGIEGLEAKLSHLETAFGRVLLILEALAANVERLAEEKIPRWVKYPRGGDDLPPAA